MKRFRLFLLAIIFFMPILGVAEEENLQSQIPFIPRAQSAGNSVIAGVATAKVPEILSDAALATTLNFTRSQPNYLLNHFKGDLGEMLMDRVFTSRALKLSGGWQALTPASVGRSGIDGLYIKMDTYGRPRQLMVADAKVNNAQLGYTQNTGKQMSHDWILPRLEDWADDYQKLAQDVSNTRIRRSSRRVRRGMIVQIDDQTSAQIWKTEDGQYEYFSRSPRVNEAQIQKQAKIISEYLRSAADGKITFRSRLFTYKPDGDAHVFTIKSLDSRGNVIRGETQTIRGRFDTLPKVYRSAIRHATIQTLGQQKNFYGLPKYDQATLKMMARHCCQNPNHFYRVCVKPAILPSSIRVAGTVGSASAVVTVVDVATQFITQGNLDWNRTVRMTGLTGTSTAVGLTVAKGTSLLGASSGMANFAGGSVAGILMAGGLYFTGYATFNDTVLNMGTGVTSAALVCATPAVMMGIASTFGTASTGTAISALHGAAFTKAALAWWGGGTIAAGGGGVAAGTTTIAITTGGVALVIAAIPVAIYSWKHFASEHAQHRYLNGMADIVKERVKNGRQVEWSTFRLKPAN